jgi:hypothetical protein
MAIKIILVFVFLFSIIGFVEAMPTGPDFLNVTENESSSGSSNPEMVNTTGGFISAVNISATTQNSHWKAFVGWIDGMFTLDDSSGSSIYDWSIGTISGEVYATRASGAVAWGSVACAGSGQILAEENLLNHAGEDNISSTFSSNNTGTYVVAGVSIAAGNCYAANSYVSDVPQSGDFEEFILTDSTNIIFATEIEDDLAGFDDADYDFQMIVPENGSESFVGATPYYMYVELS